MHMSVRVAVRRRQAPPSLADIHVLEVVAPRTNMAALTSAENFFASIALHESFSVELAADSARRRALVRAGSRNVRDQLVSQLGAAYPQADLRTLSPEDDRARVHSDEQIGACTLQLRAPAYLPLRTFTDLDVDGERAAQADSMLGIVSALGDLPAGWRGLSQLVLQPAPEDWCRGYQRKSVQHPLEHDRMARGGENAASLLLFMLGIIGLLALVLQAYRLLHAESWTELTLLVAGLVGLIALVLMARRLRHSAEYDMELVREKVTPIACQAELRLVVFAPANAAAGGKTDLAVGLRVTAHRSRIFRREGTPGTEQLNATCRLVPDTG